MFDLLNKKTTGRLFCFSPEVMFLTFVLEFILAIGLFIRHKMRLFNVIALLMFVCLGVFQLSEYLVCEMNGGMLFSKIGFVFITLLPPLGIHLVTLVRGDKSYISNISYFFSVYIIYIILSGPLISQAVCEGNYVIFFMEKPYGLIFSIYYLSLLGVALILGFFGMLKSIQNDDSNKFRILFWIIIGYISFLLPTGLVYLLVGVNHDGGGSSIMCGFAIIMALILYYKIVPLCNIGKYKS
jgi:hypothetical protein